MEDKNPKFKIGQEVWFMQNRKPTPLKVTRITIDENCHCSYKLGNKYEENEWYIGATKDELQDIVFNK